jgi:hypothetical protein
VVRQVELKAQQTCNEARQDSIKDAHNQVLNFVEEETPSSRIVNQLLGEGKADKNTVLRSP